MFIVHSKGVFPSQLAITSRARVCAAKQSCHRIGGVAEVVDGILSTLNVEAVVRAMGVGFAAGTMARKMSLDVHVHECTEDGDERYFPD